MKNRISITLLLTIILASCSSEDTDNKSETSNKSKANEITKTECQSNSDFLVQGVVGRFLFREAKNVLTEGQIRHLQQKQVEINKGHGRDGTSGKEACKLLVNLYKEIDLQMDNATKSQETSSTVIECNSKQDVIIYRQYADKAIRLSLMALGANDLPLDFGKQHKSITKDYENETITQQQACKNFTDLTKKVSEAVLDSRNKNK